MALNIGSYYISPIEKRNIINNQSNKTVTPTKSQQVINTNETIFEMSDYSRDGSSTEYKNFNGTGLTSSDTILITGWIGYERSGAITQHWKNINIQTSYTTQTFNYGSVFYIKLDTSRQRLEIHTGEITCYQLNMYKLSGYDGINQVTIEPIPSDYIIPEGTLTISAPGTINAKSYASVTIPGMANPTWTAPAIISSIGKINYSITLNSGFKSVSQSFSSSITLPSVTGTTIIPNETSQIAVDSYKWTKGSIIVSAIPDSIGVYKKILNKTVNINEANVFFSSQTSVPIMAFYMCSNLSGELNLSNISYIGSSAFGSCHYITTVNAPNITRIGENAFSRCTRLTTVNMPNLSIAANYLFYSNKIENFSFPILEQGSNQWLSLASTVSIVYLPKLKAYPCLSYLYYVETFDLPELLSLTTYAFYQTSKATTFNLPKVSSINGGQIFTHCSVLSFVELPALTYMAGISIFMNCSILHTLSFPKLTSWNASNTFVNCPNLMSIYLMNSSMVSLKYSNIITNQSVPFVNSALTGSFGSFYVPSSLLTTYQTDSIWSWWSSRIVGI